MNESGLTDRNLRRKWKPHKERLTQLRSDHQRKRNTMSKSALPLRCSFVVAKVVLAFSACGILHADDWPAFDRDPQRSAASSETLKLPLEIVWSYESAQRPRPAWSEPGRTANMFEFDLAFQAVSAGGLVYFGSSADDTVYALNATDGKIKWTFTTGAPVRFAPQIADGNCIFASDDGWLYCLNAATGGSVWKVRVAPEDRMIVGNGRMISRWPCRSGAVVHNGTIYVTAGMWPAEGTYFYAIDAKTGQQKWCNDTLNALYLSYPHDGVAFGGPTPQGYLLTDGKVLVVPTGQSIPAVLSAETGKLLHWHPQRPGSTWARLGDGFMMVSGRGWQPDQELRLGEAPLFRGDGVAFYDLLTGDVTSNRKWHTYDNLPGSVRNNLERWRGQISPIGGRDRTILTGHQLFASGMGVVEALDVSGEKLQRLWKVDHPRVYSLIVAGDLVFAGSDRHVAALRRTDGSLAWQGEIDGQARGLAVANGVLYVTTDKGTVQAFTAGRPTKSIPNHLSTDEPPRTGFALVVGLRDTTVAERLSENSLWNVICLLEKTAVVAARQKLLTHGYGQRIVVHPLPEGGLLPYADFFANEILVDGSTAGIDAAEFYRVLHPCTGQLRFSGLTPDAIKTFIQKAGIPANEVKENLIARGVLAGSFDWNSQNQVDERVKWPLELLWFGGPGRERTLTRHKQGLPPPIAAHGRTFVLGDGHVTAIDAYNGCELWSRHVPNYQYVSADDQHAYIGLGTHVMQCAAQTGTLEKTYGHSLPTTFSLNTAQSFQAKGNGKFGGEIRLAQTEKGLEITLDVTTPLPDEKDCWTLWCDFRSNEKRLTPAGRGAFPLIVNTASGTLRKFDGFVGAIAPEVAVKKQEGQVVLSISFDEIKRLSGDIPTDFDLSAEITLYQTFEVRLRDRPFTQGRDPWHDGKVTFTLKGATEKTTSPLAKVPTAELSELPPYAKDWGRMPLYARHDGNVPRPPLAAQTVPDLQQRTNPLTGENESRLYLRGYGCSGTICSATMDFFRSGTFGMYDLADDSGMRNFAGVRPGCRITVVPACGVLVSAEGVGDCFCPYNFSTTMAMAPATQRKNEDWAVFVDEPRVAQMQKLTLNLGAPGDRRDESGNLWLGYPRQPMMFATGGAMGPRPHAFGLPAAFDLFEEGRPIRVNADHLAAIGTLNPWIYASGMSGVKKLELGLIYYEPRSTCLAEAIQSAPKIDAQFDDAAWLGDPGINIATDTKSAIDKGHVRIRYDADQLYLAYEQQPIIDRKGAVASWKDAYFDVLLKDTSKAAYAHFGVTSRGVESSRAIDGILPIPRLNDIKIDGQSDDWKKQGTELNLGEGRGTLRLGWNDQGLLLLLSLTPKAGEKPGPGLRAQFANLNSPALVEAVANFTKGSAEIVEAMIAGDVNAAKRKGTNPAKNAPLADVVDDPDPTKKELEKFRESHKVESPIIAKATADGLTVEALIPFDHLNARPRAGASFAIQVVSFDPASSDFNVTGGSGARRALFASGGSLSLTLTEDQTQIPPVSALAQKRDFFGTTVVFSAKENEIASDLWTSKAIVDETSFRVEAAIPWHVLQSAGLSRDRLLAQFHTTGKLTPNLATLQQSFNTRSVRIYTDKPSAKPVGYTLRLHFAEIEEKKPGERVFDIKLQGKTVARGVDIVREADGPKKALIKSFVIEPCEELILEFVPQKGLPLLNGIEIISVQAH